MILAIPEYESFPASPARWDRFYHTLNDVVYIQVLSTTDPSYPLWEIMSTGAAVREDMRIVRTLVRSQYSAKDFQTYLDQIIAYIAEKWGDSFNNFMSSDAAIMIVEYTSAALDQMSWTIDRETDEWYLALAELQVNVERLAHYLGYKPRPAVSGSVNVVVTLTAGSYAYDVTLRKGHQLKGGSLIFELTSDQTIPAGDTQKTVGVVQGQTFSETFVSDGSPLQEFKLSRVPSDQSLAYRSVGLYVGLDEWAESDFLPFDDSEEFEVMYMAAPPKVRFGNGVMGKIPPAGSQVRVSYMSTSGALSSSIKSGDINLSLTPVVVNYRTIPIGVTNGDNLPSGGSPAEDLDSVKANAPRYFLSADRLVTQGDYMVLAGRFIGSAGAVAKANAEAVRGIEGEVQLNALLDAVAEDRVALSGYLNSVKSTQDVIKTKTGTLFLVESIRYQVSQIKSGVTVIDGLTNQIDTKVTEVEATLESARAIAESAQIRMEFMPFQELIGQGDGTSVLFSKKLAKLPIKEGSLAVVLATTTASKSASNGDCDADPGRIDSATIGFVSTDVGKTIRIGAEYRQITVYKSATKVEYSGPRIYGTSLIVDVFPPAVIGYDQGDGTISGTGIASGSVSYTTGQITVEFSSAPQGLSGKYGAPIMSTYQYKAEALRSLMDDIGAACDDASALLPDFSTYGDGIDEAALTISDLADFVGERCDEIDVAADETKGYADSALYIPDQIDADIEALREYLDTVISGNCKANIVRVSALVLDSNGFYTAPSLALLEQLKTYLDARKIVTVDNSVISGAYYLVKVKLSVEAEIEDLFVWDTVSQRITVALDSIFKGRDYGKAFRRSEYYEAVSTIDGVKSCNINITDVAYADPANTGTPPEPDENGNLYVATYEVVTKWELTVTQIEG